jgi:hypothetical protein
MGAGYDDHRGSLFLLGLPQLQSCYLGRLAKASCTAPVRVASPGRGFLLLT